MKMDIYMDITYKNYKILKKIISGEFLSFEDFGMSKKQFIYCIDRINEYLDSFDVPPIEIKNEKLIVPSSLIENTEKIISDDGDIYFNSKDRIMASELLIASEFEELFINDLMCYFGVSKNTVFNDIKELGSILEKENLKIDFSRKDGYRIRGNELDIRKRIIYNLETLFYDVEMFDRILFVDKSELLKCKNIINEIEDKLEVRFIESRAKYMPYIILIMVQRIKNGNLLNENELFFNELNDTLQFNIVSELLGDAFNISRTENYYLTLLLLSTSISKFNIVGFERKNQLSTAISEMINVFEKNACINFSDKDTLNRNILQHMISAYYRIKYDLRLSQDVINIIETGSDNIECKIIESLVDKSIYPMNNFLDMEMPEIEKKFLSLQFAAWIRREELIPNNKPRAIVVCLNGITISNLMFMSLKQILPEINFIDVVSLRDLNEISADDYDIIFSTSDIKSNKKVFLVNSAIDLKDKQKIRERVLGELYNHDIPITNLGIVYKTIDSILSKDEAEYLKDKISKQLETVKTENEENTESKQSLIELIDPKRINIINSVKDYKEAIELAFQPLVKDYIVTKKYVEKIISNYDYRYPNFLFGEHAAVPHASPNDGSNELSMSFLKINNGVNFSDDCKVYVVVALAPIDKSSHLKALIQLSSLTTNDEDMNSLINMDSKDEIKKILEKYSEKKEEER